MRRLFIAALALPLLIGGSAGSAPSSLGASTQEAPGCEGQWLTQITFDNRDMTEQAIAVFGSDGRVVLHSPPVVPPLPNTDDEPLYVSDSVGTWREGSGVHCTFDVVRLLAAEDGASIGAVNLRGGIVIDESGLGLDGTFDYDQSSGLGQTVTSGTGTLVGTSILG